MCSVGVALRKESVDRNIFVYLTLIIFRVALRKESVDRNNGQLVFCGYLILSLSARRAWIEILVLFVSWILVGCRSPQGERG